MKKIILYSLFTLLLAGCVNKLNNLRNPKPQTIESETFEKIDVDNSGEISKNEFKKISNKNNVNYWNPVLGFYSVLGMVAILLIISNFLQSNKKKKDV